MDFREQGRPLVCLSNRSDRMGSGLPHAQRRDVHFTERLHPWAVDPRNVATGCTFGSTAQKIWFRNYAGGGFTGTNGVNNTVLYDLSGCVLGSGGGAAFPAGNGLLAHAGGSSDTTWNAIAIGGGNPFGQVLLYNGDPGGTVAPLKTDATISIGSASQTVAWEHLSGSQASPGPWVFYPWNAPIETSGSVNRNAVAFAGSVPDLSGVVTVMGSCNAAGKFLNLRIPYTTSASNPTLVQRPNYYASSSEAAVTSYSSVANLDAADGTGYYYDSGANPKQLYLRIKLPTSTVTHWSSTYGSVFSGAPVFVRITP